MPRGGDLAFISCSFCSSDICCPTAFLSKVTLSVYHRHSQFFSDVSKQLIWKFTLATVTPF